MIESGTSIKLLRRLGIALIFAPDPFTTACGVALVLVARHLSRRREASRNKRLRETVQYYLDHTSLFRGDADGKSGAPSTVKLLSPGKEHAILGQITGRRSFEANPDPSVCQSWLDMRSRTVHHTIDIKSLYRHYKTGDSFKVESCQSGLSGKSDKVIHHTINMEWLSRCYKVEGSAVAHSNRAQTCGAREEAAHHSIDMRLLSQRYKTGSVERAKAKHHTINMELLLKRYGSAMYKMALKTR